MYTQSNPGTGEIFDQNTIPSRFNNANPTIVIAHGYEGSGDESWVQSMKDTLLAKAAANIVVVDWSEGAGLINYYQCASNTRTTGAYTALVIDNLIVNGALPADIWLMGFSLGAHVVGHAGMRSGYNYNRVTGLDPSGPWFENSLDTTVGINPTSGSFVDIIHTDTQEGQIRNLGHIDFYPAGGASQPGCRSGETPNPSNDCDHARAWIYMEQSIKTDCFLSRSKCVDYTDVPNSCSECLCGEEPCARMGYLAPTSCQLDGWFYVGVTSASPYCVG
jgi:pancreatic lipase-related protein 1/phosphatidic acid-selective phospholipase A1